jgi:hypothetical protein
MEHDEPVPEADAIEQAESEEPHASELPEELGEKPEADALEQAQSVEESRTRVVPRTSDEVPEADWLEQSVVEPLDDEDAR